MTLANKLEQERTVSMVWIAVLLNYLTGQYIGLKIGIILLAVVLSNKRAFVIKEGPSLAGICYWMLTNSLSPHIAGLAGPADYQWGAVVPLCFSPSLNRLQCFLKNSLVNLKYSVSCMDEWTIKNPICQLFFIIDMLTDFAALCLTDFIDWRYIHSWLVFSTQLVNCCPHARRNCTCVLFPLYLLSGLSPPPFQTKCTVYIYCTDNVWLGVWGVVELCCRSYSAAVLHSVSDQIQNLQNCFTTPNKNDQ